MGSLQICPGPISKEVISSECPKRDPDPNSKLVIVEGVCFFLLQRSRCPFRKASALLHSSPADEINNISTHAHENTASAMIEGLVKQYFLHRLQL